MSSQPSYRMSSGLVHLTRLHSNRSPSEGSVSINSGRSSLVHSCDDKSWSWKHLRSEFQAKDAEKLFKKYQIRLQHNFFMVLLMLNIFFNVAAIIVYYNDEPNEAFPGPVIMRAAALTVYIAFLVLACLEEQWLRPAFARVVAAGTVLIAMLFAEHGGALTSFSGEGDTIFSLQRIRPTYYLIITNHIFLPFPSRVYAGVSTILIVAIEISLTINTRFASDCTFGFVYRYAIADAVFYATSAMIGGILTYLLEIANRRAFLDHRRCVQSKFKLDYEKEQQDQLLNSCLPKHLAERVRNDMRQVMATIEKDQRIPPRPFNELYVEKFKNVSILYADIVNSMLLAAKLTPNDLVETLNELFGRFDEMAEKHNCLRIKLLGDCYYCVSGVPEYDPDHAINTVRMGLEMIRIIRSVREERSVDVNMRIGIHSGMVLSGMMGLHKWQYDIWSKDSMLASAMEHHGVPGLVHVTKTTHDLLPESAKGELQIKERRNSNGEITYLIDKRNVPHFLHPDSAASSPCARRRGHSEKLRNSIHRFRRSSSFDSIVFTRKRTILEASLKKYREMVKLVNQVMETDIDTMPLSKKSQWLQPRGINPFCLNFTNKFGGGNNEDLESTFRHERHFAMQSDPLFKYYLYCSALIFLAIILIKISIPKMIMPPKLQWSLSVTLVVMITSLVVTYSKPEKLSYWMRILIWLIISVSLLVCSTIDIVTDNCFKKAGHHVNCAYSWYYTFCLILSMTSVSLFIRINLWLKFAVHLSALITYIVLTKNNCSGLSILDRKVKWKSLGYAPHIGHLYYMGIVALLLHIIDRQIEYMLRLDFQWTTKLESEKKEAEMVGDINQILLENILPVHVAERYLHSSIAPDSLYHESYDNIAVMFAAIPNYIDFYTETTINEEGLKCLLLLNEIICDFDKVLDDNSRSFCRIEKIKTIGSTYMAAAGLQPGRGSVDSDVSAEDVTTNVIALVNFATTLMETIQRINRDALQDFKLRVGIAVGPVIAGIVGAVKPQYDIWGDTVNVASRMESTGITGRIQITEAVRDMIAKSDIQVECRGPVMVKGKGELTTYLVITPFDCDENETTRV